MIISVIGSSSAKPEHLELADAVGRELARRKVMVACGGMTGVMEAVCRGAKAEGGTTIGILPGRRGSEFNPYIDIPIFTTMGYARNIIVVHTGQACIAVGGAFGTLSEIAYAMDAKIPVIGLSTWTLTVKGDGDPVVDGIIPAGDPVEAVDKALAAAGGPAGSVSNQESGVGKREAESSSSPTPGKEPGQGAGARSTGR